MSTAGDQGIASPIRRLYRERTGQQGRVRGVIRHFWLSLAALAVLLLPHSLAAAPRKEVRRILILNEVGTSYPATKIINEGIQTALQDSPDQLEFYSEYLDTLLFPDPAVQQELRDFYLRKYQNRKPEYSSIPQPCWYWR